MLPKLHPVGDGPARKGYRNGTHRLVEPAETVARVAPFLSTMGITRVANVTGLDTIGIPVVVACRPNSRSVAVANGKGLDLAAAEASALMEAVEAYHAERITRPLKLGSHEEVGATHRLVDVAALPRHTSSLYHPDLPLLWVEGYDLLQEEPLWIPFEVVHTNYTVPLPAGSGCFVMSSNGLASGNHLLEAISHGICEVVERDATTLWELSGEVVQRRARVDLASVDDPACRAALAKYERAGIDVAVYETTSDIRLPAFLCTILDRHDPLRRFFRADGMGCHPAREVALLRALTEAAQTRLTIIAGSRDDIFAEDYEQLRQPDTARVFQARIEGPGSARDFQEVPTWEGDSFEADVACELDQLRVAGIDRVVIVDLTRPDVGLPVVRVVIPGLEYWLAAPDYKLGARARARLASR
jgi:YcaO-like protein with predicted kinase domain